MLHLSIDYMSTITTYSFVSVLKNHHKTIITKLLSSIILFSSPETIKCSKCVALVRNFLSTVQNYIKKTQHTFIYVNYLIFYISDQTSIVTILLGLILNL